MSMATKKADPVEREIRIQSPAGPVHVFKGFVDDGEGAIVLRGLPEDEYGHWEPYYRLTANGQDVGAPEIVTAGQA
jgi:hypothetical protein